MSIHTNDPQREEYHLKEQLWNELRNDIDFYQISTLQKVASLLGNEAHLVPSTTWRAQLLRWAARKEVLPDEQWNVIRDALIRNRVAFWQLLENRENAVENLHNTLQKIEPRIVQRENAYVKTMQPSDVEKAQAIIEARKLYSQIIADADNIGIDSKIKQQNDEVERARKERYRERKHAKNKTATSTFALNIHTQTEPKESDADRERLDKMLQDINKRHDRIAVLQQKRDRLHSSLNHISNVLQAAGLKNFNANSIVGVFDEHTLPTELNQRQKLAGMEHALGDWLTQPNLQDDVQDLDRRLQMNHAELPKEESLRRYLQRIALDRNIQSPDDRKQFAKAIHALIDPKMQSAPAVPQKKGSDGTAKKAGILRRVGSVMQVGGEKLLNLLNTRI